MTGRIPQERYSGRRGANYFAWQSEIGRVGGTLNREKFARYVSNEDVVLDFGCGGGYLLAGLPARKRLGIEVNEHARAEAAANGVQVFTTLREVADEGVDVVISNHALEHVHDPFRELREIRRVLRDGGRLVLWLPINDWRSDSRVKQDRNGHLFAWTTLTLTNLLREVGFVVESCEVVSSAWSLRTLSIERHLPAPFRRLMRKIIAVARRRRQLVAIARRPGLKDD